MTTPATSEVLANAIIDRVPKRVPGNISQAIALDYLRLLDAMRGSIVASSRAPANIDQEEVDRCIAQAIEATMPINMRTVEVGA